MSQISRHTDQLLNSFNLSQLRDLTLVLARTSNISLASKNREQLLAEIRKTGDANKISLAAQRLETIAPYKHVFIFSLLGGPRKQEFDALRESVDQGFPNLSEGTATPHELAELTPQITIFDSPTKRIYVTFVHLVQTWIWERTSPTKKELREFRRRHPVVATLRPNEGLMTVSFPGYTQGAGGPTKERATYSLIAKQACDLLRAKAKIDARPFPLKPAIESTLQRDKDVIDVRRLITGPLGGKIMFFSGEEQSNDLVQYVINYFRQHAQIALTTSQVRALFRSAEALDILLFWKRLEVLTRAAFYDAGPELLFIWRNAAAETTRIDAVLKELVTYDRFTSQPELGKAALHIEQADRGVVLRPSALTQMFNLNSDESMSLLHEAVKKGFVSMVFRVNTESVLQHFQNNWRKSLSEFPRTVTDEHGQVLDLTDGSQIEIGFERINK